MSRIFLLGVVILLTVVDCNLTDFGRVNHKPNDPDVRKVDELLRESFQQTGELLTVAKRLSKVGIQYDLSYESGLKVILYMEKESGILKLLDYIYDTQDLSKKETYNQKCKSKGLKPGFVIKERNQDPKVQQKLLTSKTALSPPSPLSPLLTSSLLIPGSEIMQKQLRVSSGVKLNDKERDLCREITLLKDYPVDAQLIEISSFQGYWLFNYICNHDKDHIIQYEVTFDKLGKFLLRDQRKISLPKPKLLQTSLQRPKQPINMREQKIPNDLIDSNQTPNAMKMIVQQKQVYIKHPSPIVYPPLEYILVQPYERKFLPYVTNAIDAMKLQLQQDANKTQLLQVYYAKKTQQIIVFKLICQSDKRKFQFLYECPKQIQIDKSQTDYKQVAVEDIRKQVNKSKIDTIKTEVVAEKPSESSELAKYQTLTSTYQKESALISQNKLSFQFPEYELTKLPFIKRQPHYIAFLTARLQRDFIKAPVFEEFLNFLSNQKKLSNSKFAIILMNKNKFGLRVVLQNQSDNNLYQAVAELVQKDSKYSFNIISWKELHSLHEITVNPFAEYYNVQKDEELFNMLTKAFSPGSAMKNINSLQSIQKRVAANGIYYKIVFNTKNSKQFQSQILFNPEINFANVIEYQQVNMPYDYSLEEDYPLPYNKDFVDIEDSLLKKYGTVFKNAQIKYVKKSPANQKNNLKDNFRIVFYSHSGRYEVILSYDYNTRQTKIFRMEQMDQGYKLRGYSDIHTHIDKKVIQQSRKYLTKLFQSIQSYPYTEDKAKGPLNQSFVEIDEHMNYGIYYRIGYNNPLPVVLTLFDDKRGQNPSQSLILLSGVQSIATAPINKYYSLQLFKGFIEITPSELKYNKAFPNLQSTLKSKYSDILSKNNQVVGVFSKSLNDRLIYKITYKVQDKDIYIGTCEYNPVENRYGALSLEKNKNLTIQGTYGHGCQNIGKQQKECLQCTKGWVNTNGRCYEQIQGCDVQIAGACYFCRNGFIRNSNNICFANPQKATNSVKQQQATLKQSSIQKNNKQKQSTNLPSKSSENNSMSEKINTANPQAIVSEFKYDRNPSINDISRTKKSLPTLPKTKVQQPNLSRIESQIEHKSLRRESQDGSTLGHTETSHRMYKSYNAQNDPNCLSYDGTVCRVCTYRFYLEDGICRKVSHSCSNYDRFTGLCTSCYSGYYLTVGNCLQIDPLCAETTSRGKCSKCFKQYILIEGRCVYESNQAVKSNHARDPLCAEFNDIDSCQRCVDGAYMSQKRVCRIADPKCQVFNKKNQLCDTCIRGYKQVKGRCLNKKYLWRDQS